MFSSKIVSRTFLFFEVKNSENSYIQLETTSSCSNVFGNSLIDRLLLEIKFTNEKFIESIIYFSKFLKNSLHSPIKTTF